jgi:hypothetical protein
MEQDLKKMAGGVVENAASGGLLFILSSFNVRPGNAIAIADGKIRYDGPAQSAPPEILKIPGAILLMHEHDKARLTAALNKAHKGGRIPGPVPQVVPGMINRGEALATETMLARTLPFPGEELLQESNPASGDLYAEAAKKAMNASQRHDPQVLDLVRAMGQPRATELFVNESNPASDGPGGEDYAQVESRLMAHYAAKQMEASPAPRWNACGNSELDAGTANHFDPNKRFFDPK